MFFQKLTLVTEAPSLHSKVQLHSCYQIGSPFYWTEHTRLCLLWLFKGSKANVEVPHIYTSGHVRTIRPYLGGGYSHEFNVILRWLYDIGKVVYIGFGNSAPAECLNVSRVLYEKLRWQSSSSLSLLQPSGWNGVEACESVKRVKFTLLDIFLCETRYFWHGALSFSRYV